MTTFSKAFAEIERVTPDGGEWCDLEKAGQLAALVLALRPEVIVEIGVFLGGSLIPMALAQRRYAQRGRDTTVAIDPWAADASVEGQHGDNAAWWGKLDHEAIYRRFNARLVVHGLTELVKVVRLPSDAVTPPARCDLLHIDGNHGPQAMRDFERFAPSVLVGGILVFDDLGWEGGHVSAARDRALASGFVECYPLGTGAVLQRVRT